MKRLKKSGPKNLLINFLVLAALNSALCVLGWSADGFAGTFHRVKQVIDGDTVILDNGEHVRLIGLDAPESRQDEKLFREAKRNREDIDSIIKKGKKASQFVRELVQGKEVRLEYDIEKRDKYGRQLAYVYELETYRNKVDVISPAGYEIMNGNEIFINATILKSGFASPLTIPPNVKYAKHFKELAQAARDNKMGLWQN